MTKKLILVAALLVGTLVIAAPGGTRIREKHDIPSVAVTNGGVNFVAKPGWSYYSTIHNWPLNVYYVAYGPPGSLCVVAVRIGNFNGSAYGQEHPNSGNGTCGKVGISVWWLSPDGILRSNPILTDWMCAVGNTSKTGCTQLSDGSLWAQMPMPTYPGTVVKVETYVCLPDNVTCARRDMDPFPG